jgi:hypothetical protein
VADLFGPARLQIAREPIEALPIFRRLLPLPEVADVALVPQLTAHGSSVDIIALSMRIGNKTTSFLDRSSA